MRIEEQSIYLASLLFAIFIAIILVVFMVSLFVQQRRYIRLQEEKLRAEINATEKERTAIATELHNEIGPYLSGIKMRLSVIDSNDPALEECQQGLNQCIVQVLDLSRSIAPLSIFHLSFSDALNQYLDRLLMNNKPKLDISTKGDIVLDEEVSAHVYRILQEIVLNCVKHSKAKELKIVLSIEDDMLLIQTADDGIGFDTQQVLKYKNSGIGLMSIQTRVDFLKGVISVPSTPTQGTKYNIRIPLNYAK
jgi:signal transduction histidine kinase